MATVSAPKSSDYAIRQARTQRAKDIQTLRSKGTSRTPQERDRLLDLLAEQVLNQ